MERRLDFVVVTRGQGLEWWREESVEVRRGRNWGDRRS